MPTPAAYRGFSTTQIATARASVVQRLAAGTRFPDRPYLLNGYPRARFMGEVVFRDGWVVSDPPID